jgi:adenine deaminase
MNTFRITANCIDLLNQTILPQIIVVSNGIITQFLPAQENECSNYILPGFIDAHVHVESSMLIPSEFARLAVLHGTVATISDPHEIGNVLGKDGVKFMIENGKQTPFKFYFGAPSCVPATQFETAGATISPKDIEEIFGDSSRRLQNFKLYYIKRNKC